MRSCSRQAVEIQSDGSNAKEWFPAWEEDTDRDEGCDGVDTDWEEGGVEGTENWEEEGWEEEGCDGSED